MTKHTLSEMWVEFDPVALEPTSSEPLWFVGRDARGSVRVTRDSEQITDLVAVTPDLSEARRAVEAISGGLDRRTAA